MLWYYIKRTFFVLTYMTGMFVSFYTFLMPAIYLHGIWHLLFVFVSVFLVGALSTFSFLSVRKPQATFKRRTS